MGWVVRSGLCSTMSGYSLVGMRWIGMCAYRHESVCACGCSQERKGWW